MRELGQQALGLPTPIIRGDWPPTDRLTTYRFQFPRSRLTILCLREMSTHHSLDALDDILPTPAVPTTPTSPLSVKDPFHPLAQTTSYRASTNHIGISDQQNCIWRVHHDI